MKRSSITPIVITVVLGVVALLAWAGGALLWLTRSNATEGATISVAPPAIVELGGAAAGQADESDPVEGGDTADVKTDFVFSDIAGTWDMTFTRGYFDSEDAAGNPMAEELVTGVLTIPADQSEAGFEAFLSSLTATINGDADPGYVATGDVLVTGKLHGSKLLLYLDIDSFYLDLTAEVLETVEPAYFPVVVQDVEGLMVGYGQQANEIEVGGATVYSVATIELIRRAGS